MKLTITLLLSLCLLASCRTSKPIQQVPVHADTKVIERLVPVVLPADSAAIRALLECDSMGQVHIKELAEWKSKGMQSQINLKTNALTYKIIRITDTIFLPSKDSIISKDIPVYVDVPREVNKITGWQWFQIWLGRIAALIVFGYLMFKRIIK